MTTTRRWRSTSRRRRGCSRPSCRERAVVNVDTTAGRRLHGRICRPSRSGPRCRRARDRRPGHGLRHRLLASAAARSARPSAGGSTSRTASAASRRRGRSGSPTRSRSGAIAHVRRGAGPRRARGGGPGLPRRRGLRAHAGRASGTCCGGAAARARPADRRARVRRGPGPGEAAPMGRAATGNADLTVITSDNPRSEDPLAIIAEIEPGAQGGRRPLRSSPSGALRSGSPCPRRAPATSSSSRARDTRPTRSSPTARSRSTTAMVAAEELRSLGGVA